MGLAFYACAEKSVNPVVRNNYYLTPVKPCTDSFANIVFVNTGSVEIKVSISNKTSTIQGTTVVNTWHNYRNSSVKPGDSAIFNLHAEVQFMYSIFGPSSNKVYGVGTIAEEKFTLLPCERKRVVK